MVKLTNHSLCKHIFYLCIVFIFCNKHSMQYKRFLCFAIQQFMKHFLIGRGSQKELTSELNFRKIETCAVPIILEI